MLDVGDNPVTDPWVQKLVIGQANNHHFAGSNSSKSYSLSVRFFLQNLLDYLHFKGTKSLHSNTDIKSF